MSRRAQGQDLEFGSDSFLDIVANVVGVLIILIVIIGIRVARQATVEVREQVKSQQQAIASVPPAQVIAPEERAEAKPVLSMPETPVAPVLAAPVVAGPTQADLEARLAENDRISQENFARRQQYEMLMEQQRQLQTELEQWNAAYREVTSTQTSADEKRSAIAERLARVQAELLTVQQEASQRQSERDQLLSRVQAAQGSLVQLEQRVTDNDSKLKQAQVQLARASEELSRDAQRLLQMRTRLEEEFSAAQSQLAILQKINDEQPSSGNKIRHQLTSLGSIIVKEERHFRLENRSITYLPILELVNLVKTDLEYNRETLLRNKSYLGNVGPIDGFSLRYKAARQETDVVDQLQMGGRGYKIGVEYWELFESGLADSEPTNIALEPGSKFLTRVQRLDPEKECITLWVYPDSYEIYQQLRGPLEEAGFQIAARPLPKGVPIAGSPKGSRSLSQ